MDCRARVVLKFTRLLTLVDKPINLTPLYQFLVICNPTDN